MNSESTAKGPFEQNNRYLGDWLCEHERRHFERRMTGWTLIAVGLVVAALLFAATFGMAHPVLAQVASFLGVR
jgi:hypothetical protein